MALGDGAKIRTALDPQVGVGGWMGFFLFGCVISVLVYAVDIVQGVQSLNNPTVRLGMSTAGVTGTYVALLVGEALFAVTLAVGFAMTASKWPLTPTYWRIALPGLFVLAIGFIWAQDSMMQAFKEDSTPRGTGPLRLLMWCAIWFLYWSKSTRARATFPAAYRA